MLFSIVMPVYNASKYIRESIEDIQNQTYMNWELICVDDGSKDESFEIVREYQAADQRIILLRQENAGAGAARNRGLETARGQYVLFLDADDRFENNLLQKLSEKCFATKADIVIYAADSFDDLSGKTTPLPKHLNMEIIHCDENGVVDAECKDKNVFKISYTAVWNKAFNRDFLNRNGIVFQEIYVVDTLYFSMCALAMANVLAIIDERLIHYRTGVAGSQISNSDKAATGAFEAGIMVKQYLSKKGCYAKYEKQFLNYILDNIKGRFGSFRTLEAEEKLHNVLYEGGLEELGINEDTIDSLENESLRSFFSDLKQDDFKASLLKNASEWRRKNLISNRRFLFPDSIQTLLDERVRNDGYCKVALYGAGAVGRSYFTQLINTTGLKIVGWYDKQYESCGYPVLNPKLLEQETDCIIVIAIESKKVADAIKTDILKYGIPSENILWDRSVER